MGPRSHASHEDEFSETGLRSHDRDRLAGDDRRMRTTTEQNERTASRVRRATLRLALATAVSSTAMVVAAEVAHARIAVNHNEAIGAEQP